MYSFYINVQPNLIPSIKTKASSSGYKNNQNLTPDELINYKNIKVSINISDKFDICSVPNVISHLNYLETSYDEFKIYFCSFISLFVKRP